MNNRPIDDFVDDPDALRDALVADIKRLEADLTHASVHAKERAEERDEWRQAARVEAALRAEFLARAEAAEAEVKRLRAEISNINARVIVILCDVERLRAALKPFADFNTEDFPGAMRAFDDTDSLTMGDFRRARAALTFEGEKTLEQSTDDWTASLERAKDAGL